MTIHAHTLSGLRDALNHLAETLTPDTPVPWDVPFGDGEGRETQVTLAIGIAGSVHVTPRTDP